MGCGESKHAVATENTLTKTKSRGKAMENKPTNVPNVIKVNENVTKNEVFDGLKLEKEEILKKLDEREGRGEKGVVHDHKNGQLDGGAVAAAAAEVKDEIKKVEGSKPVVSDEASGQPELHKDSPVVPEEKKPENDSLVASDQKSGPENISPVVSEEKKPENDSLVVSDEKSGPQNDSPVVPEEKKPENDSPVVSEEKSGPENDSPVASEEKKPENDSPVVSGEKSEPENDYSVLPKENNAAEEGKGEDVANKEKEEIVVATVEETKSPAEEVVEAAVEETKSSTQQETASDQNENDKAAATPPTADEKAN